MTWRRTGDVLCNSHDLPNLSSQPATGAGPAPARPRAGPWHSVTISLTGATVPRNPTRPPCYVRTAVMKPGGGNGVRRRACIRTPIPPPGCMLALRTSWAGVWEFGDTEVPGGGNPVGTDVYVAWRVHVGMCMRDGYCFSGERGEHTTPMLLHFMHLGKNIRAGKRRRWNGFELLRRNIYTSSRRRDMSTGRETKSLAQACRHCLVHAG